MTRVEQRLAAVNLAVALVALFGGVLTGLFQALEYAGVGTTPWGTEVIGFSASTELDREDFGMTWNAALETGGVLVGKKLKIEIEVEAIRQA